MISTRLIKTTLIISSISIILSACGGGGGGSASSGSKPATPGATTNVAPNINDMPTQSINERAAFSFTPTVSDSDGTVNEYKWEQISGSAVTNGFVHSLSSLEFIAPEVLKDEVLTFKLTVTDDDNATASKNVDVTIKAFTNLTEINFDDNGLNQCLHSSHYAEKDLGIVEVSCHGYGIQSIDDLEKFEHLIQVDFTNNSIADLSPLAEHVALQSVWLPQNNVADLSPLSGLSNLTGLNIANNKVNDLTPLSALTKLEQFSAFNDSQGQNNNDIRDISPLSAATNLKLLWLVGNSLQSLEPIRNMTNLNSLTFGQLDPSSDTDDISPLAQLTNLNELLMANHNATDLMPLAQLNSLNKLTIYSSKATDITPLAQLKQLTNLHLFTTNLVDTSPLMQLTQLEKLHVGGYTTSNGWYDAKLENVSFLEHLVLLKELSIGLSQVSNVDSIAQLNLLESFNYDRNKGLDLTPLAGLTQLRTLKLWPSENGISDLTALANLNNLELLFIQDGLLEINTFQDISALSNKAKLTSLVLDGEVEDLTPINGLINLELLHLSHNQIIDVDPIFALEKITGLSLFGNDGISCADLELLEQSLALQNFEKPESCVAN
ncbi:leucine-rich repeat domain-containing protein [Thalassotalea marina]|uniref:Leucine-rich repeat domain-containing protein n=1 Tax=Thalassotalea marina TaxID=1673741 RepID=A0A919EMJ2_9GAMM|nr:leucine-rich repeat domain-containing protein [Thalassotalea marina]GHG03170.1 hypothetical protein GCM10017161_35400 [Thalassotalea marina]